MGVFKGLFVGVYASNSAIRVLFLPLCYLLLSTPFTLVIAHYYHFDSRILAALFGERSLTDTLLQGFVLLIALLLPTRVQQVPYWVPGMRHWGNVVFGGERWMSVLRYVDVCEMSLG
jgi:hypothetical protein